MTTPCRVSLPIFEGPLDLLLHLIKRNEVPITDIPIATITDQYLAMLEEIPELNLDGAGEYLVMASTLLYLKSRTLLPAEAETEVEEDPRAELVERLVEYQRFREVAVGLGERPVLARDVFAGAGEALEPGAVDVGVPLVRDASLGDLLDALRVVLRRAHVPETHEVEEEGVSVRSCMERILAHFALGSHIEFARLFGPAPRRSEVIVIFLALLELIRLRLVRARQSERFGSIELELTARDVAEAGARLAEVTSVEEWRGGEGEHGSGTTSNR